MTVPDRRPQDDDPETKRDARTHRDRHGAVNWSVGGIIGLEIAMPFPERLDHLFAHAANIPTDGVDPAVTEAPVFLGTYVGWMAEDYARLSPTPDRFDAFVTRISGMWASEPNRADGLVAAISVPTAVVVGDHDEAILPALTEKIASLIPGAELVILPETSHFAMLQVPAEYAAAI